MATEKPEPYCGANQQSEFLPDHVHYCRLPVDHPDTPGHVCSKCKMWFWWEDSVDLGLEGLVRNP